MAQLASDVCRRCKCLPECNLVCRYLLASAAVTMELHFILDEVHLADFTGHLSSLGDHEWHSFGPVVRYVVDALELFEQSRNSTPIYSQAWGVLHSHQGERGCSDSSHPLFLGLLGEC
jgi:hypothetical protein